MHTHTHTQIGYHTIDNSMYRGERRVVSAPTEGWLVDEVGAEEALSSTPHKVYVVGERHFETLDFDGLAINIDPVLVDLVESLNRLQHPTKFYTQVSHNRGGGGGSSKHLPVPGALDSSVADMLECIACSRTSVSTPRIQRCG